MTYGIYNLQRLHSNVQLVMCHTNNVLVKSNSLATLNSTSTHFVMDSHQDITYCCMNIRPQGELRLSLYTPYAYSANTLIHFLNVCTYTFGFRGLQERHYSPLRISEIMCKCIKWCHFVFHTHTLRIFFETGN
jgi:hypothetical protein